MTIPARTTKRTGKKSPTTRKWIDPETNAWKLAEEQGISPIKDARTLYGNFWPEDESVDDFIAAMKEWDREGSR